MGGQPGDGHGPGLCDGLLPGAFEDEVPGVRVREAAGAVEGGAGAGALQQGPVPQGDVARVRAGGVTAAGSPGCPARAAWSQPWSRRARKPAAPGGGPGGAVTARDRAAWVRQAAGPVPVPVIWNRVTAGSRGGRARRDTAASSGQTATLLAPVPCRRRRVRWALRRAPGLPLQSGTTSSGRGAPSLRDAARVAEGR
ncbi:MAG TPA: hypothetical protein VMV92_20815 [Streptosporangiaceae bacterium]|nr:hypothetical protein [Streptosporangiaceae bacterium]